MRSSASNLQYGLGVLDYNKRPGWHYRKKFRWFMVFPECTHTASGYAQTEEACEQAGRLADTQHAMHHARLEQRYNPMKGK